MISNINEKLIEVKNYGNKLIEMESDMKSNLPKTIKRQKYHCSAAEQEPDLLLTTNLEI